MAREDEIQDKYPVSVTGNTPVTEPDRDAGQPLNGPGGYGVQNGVPYGTQLRDEKREMAAAWKFFPAKRRALAAATRRALGR